VDEGSRFNNMAVLTRPAAKLAILCFYVLVARPLLHGTSQAPRQRSYSPTLTFGATINSGYAPGSPPPVFGSRSWGRVRTELRKISIRTYKARDFCLNTGTPCLSLFPVVPRRAKTRLLPIAPTEPPPLLPEKKDTLTENCTGASKQLSTKDGGQSHCSGFRWEYRYWL
jgi:hypothetical protein